MRAFAYDNAMKSANPDAPPFPPDLVAAAESEDVVHTAFWRGRTDGATAGRISSDGPCAIVLVEWPQAPPPPSLVLPTVIQSLAFALVLLLTGLLVTGPIVGRVRRLQAHVEADGDGDEGSAWNDEIGDLARALNSSRQRIKDTIEQLTERDRALSDYVANTTHDLAIPLTVLQHRLTRARDQISRDSDAWKHVEVALEESHYIAALIRNMSLATKLERGEVAVTLHETNLNELVERVFTRHAPIADGKRLEFNLGLPDQVVDVQCDSVMIEQALSNLVQNAVQYTPEGGHVSVVLERTSHGFEFMVVDDGPGIPTALLERVTRRGVRGDDARNRNEGGQGFGLSITRRVVETHGWTLSLDSANPGLRASITDRSDAN